MIKKLNNINDCIEKYYEVNESTINNINNNNISNDIKNIINEKDINIQFQNIIKIYKSMNFNNEILIKYKIEKGDKEICIFGEKFGKNNKDI